MYSTGGGELWCMKAFSQLSMRLAIHVNTYKSKALADLYGRLSHTLIRANARAILTRSYSSRWMNFVCNCLYCVRLCVHMCKMWMAGRLDWVTERRG